MSRREMVTHMIYNDYLAAKDPNQISKSTLPIKTESNEEAKQKTRVVRLKKPIDNFDRDRSLSSVMSTLSERLQQKLNSNPTTNRADGGESAQYKVTEPGKVAS